MLADSGGRQKSCFVNFPFDEISESESKISTLAARRVISGDLEDTDSIIRRSAAQKIFKRAAEEARLSAAERPLAIGRQDHRLLSTDFGDRRRGIGEVGSRRHPCDLSIRVRLRKI